MTGTDHKSGPSEEGKCYPRRALHGRRQGRRMRSGLKQLLAELLPKVRIELSAGGRPLDPAALFSTPPADLWLEIGFGGGEHLAWQAGRNPEVGFLGAEIFVNGVAALLRQVRDEGLDNVRILQGDGRELLEALPPRSLGRVFILFSDPWHKMRHHKRRIVRRETLDRLAGLMKDGAELRLATDHPGYLEWMLQRVCDHPDFQWLAEGPDDWRERPPDWPPTRYEQKALSQGRRPVYLRFLRRPRREKSLASEGVDA
jgi:tRNA (guanine-N7-)-methyltransferase